MNPLLKEALKALVVAKTAYNEAVKDRIGTEQYSTPNHIHHNLFLHYHEDAKTKQNEMKAAQKEFDRILESICE